MEKRRAKLHSGKTTELFLQVIYTEYCAMPHDQMRACVLRKHNTSTTAKTNITKASYHSIENKCEHIQTNVA